MKRLVFSLTVLFLLVAVMSAAAQQPNVLRFNDFSVQYDPSLAQHVNITRFAGDPVDQMQPGGPQPPYTEFVFYSSKPLEPIPSGFAPGAGAIRYYAVADLAAYSGAQAEYTKLQNILATRPDLAPYGAVTANLSDTTLPFLPTMPAAQVLRARIQYVENETLAGVSYLTGYRQDAFPMLSGEFIYTFQGLSQDGRVYIAAYFRVNAGMVPSELAPDFNYEQFIANIQQYFTDLLAQLNAGAPADFSPSLDTLGAMFGTMNVGP